MRRCVFPCNRLESKPFKTQLRTDLPQSRVCSSSAFESTGVDYLGPLLIKQVFPEPEDVSLHKVEIVLYTSAATRAVHLDLVPDLSASAFIRSLKRFIARRGVPQLFISDNATCFKNEELRVSEELLLLKIKWNYIIEAAPWWGGFYERLVGSVKRALRKILFRATVTYEELQTIIAEVEGVLNSRPLCYSYSDDIEEEITPSHLINGRRLLTQHVINDNRILELDNQVKLSKRMKYLKLLIDNLWERWKTEYLTQLREFQTIGKIVKQITEGEMVLVHDHKTKRNKWKLGKVVKLLTGPDNIPRAAVVKISNDSGTFNIRRPVTKLYPLEINANVHVTDNERSLPLCDKDDDRNDEIECYNRPHRVAADAGILTRRFNEH